ncbi:alginate lyase family protein [Chitinophaga sp.]|uniref:alginate lyase family protein n=1 Tax=Chitinophaga sp. TaxID=1869181 RepID=UPI002F933361
MNMRKFTRTAFVLLAGYLPLQTVAQQATPATFLLKSSVLTQSKAAIAQHAPAQTKALADLLQLADRALLQGPYSVTFKSQVPPSGDKHDYMSVGPYWWPDTTKSNGLPYIRRDGEINPERYAVKDDGYFNSLCSDVNVLGLAWFYTGNEKYATQAAKLLRTWFLDPATKMNPHLNYGQSIPGITQGRGIGLIDTRAMVALIDGVQLLKGAKSFPAEDFRGVQDWFRQFLTWMLTSKIGKEELVANNNHGTWYDVQAVSMALFTEQPQLAKQILLEHTTKRIDQQFETDGRQPIELDRTLSWHYSEFNLQGFFALATMGELVQVDLWHYESPGKKTLRKGFEWMLPFAENKAAWPYKQIKSLNVDEYAELAMIAHQKYPDLDLATFWNLHPVTPGYSFLLTGWGK